MICLDMYLYINLLGIETIEKVFIKYGKLEKNTFSVFTRRFVDGAEQIMFDPPEYTTSLKAHKLIDKICVQIKDIPLSKLVDTD
jgi:hypothetical protein